MTALEAIEKRGYIKPAGLGSFQGDAIMHISSERISFKYESICLPLNNIDEITS